VCVSPSLAVSVEVFFFMVDYFVGKIFWNKEKKRGGGC